MIAARGVLYRVSDGSVLRDIKFKSRVYGDIQDHPERVKAGSARSSGGIQDGDSVITDITIFDQILDSDKEIVFFPVIWEIDGKPKYLNSFFNAPRARRINPREHDWDYFIDPGDRLAPPEQKSGEYPDLGPFIARYCKQPWDQPYEHRGLPESGNANREFYSSSPTVPLGLLTDNFSTPMGMGFSIAQRRSKAQRKTGKDYRRKWWALGYKFSLNWNHLERISKIDCGFGAGILKLNFLTKGPNGQNRGEYNMYLRFITSP